MISARNFIRALGGSAGLAIASAIFSNTLLGRLPKGLPPDVSQRVQDSIFNVPDISQLDAEQRTGVLDAYMTASKAVFYLWSGTMGCCLFLMVFVRDRGLTRTEEKTEKATSPSDNTAELRAPEEIVAPNK